MKNRTCHRDLQRIPAPHFFGENESAKTSELIAKQLVFHKVAERLHRLESSGGYYALLKRAGKQFRLSSNTKDRKGADRRLNDLRAKIGCLQISPEPKLSVTQAAQLWLETNKHTLGGSTVKRKEMCVKGLLPIARTCPFALLCRRIATAAPSELMCQYQELT